MLAAEAEFTARVKGENEELAPEFAADELACELHLTAGSAARQMDYAGTVTARLPQCLTALRDGRMHPVHLRIIEEETRILSAEDAAKADAVLAGIAGSLTTGSCGRRRTGWCWSWIRSRLRGGRTPPGRTRRSGRSGKTPATPG